MVKLILKEFLKGKITLFCIRMRVKDSILYFA